ncbi:uncharacterized protein [Periplaneta americana]|uniref:uncharacterized protein n=1 Tax=Periplaneta americana TaxID=6978 RepID=UPI0037E8AB12
MIYRIFFVSLLTFACLKDNILALKSLTERNNGELLQHIIAISEKFPDWGTEVANNLIATVGRGRDLLQHMKESVESVEEKNATALKTISDELLLFYTETLPVLDEMLKFANEGRGVLKIFKDFFTYTEPGLRNLG